MSLLEINQLELDISHEVPKCVKDFLLLEASTINFWWHLKRRLKTPSSFAFPRSGYIEFNPTSLIVLNHDRLGFIDDEEPIHVIQQ